jgi:hypothetical protein
MSASKDRKPGGMDLMGAVACTDEDAGALRAACAPRGDVETPPRGLVRLVHEQRIDEAADVLDRWIGKRRLVAAVVNPSEPELGELRHPSDRSLELAMLAIRSAFGWTRVFAERMSRSGGGTIVLPMPRQRAGNAAGEVVAYGLLGLARSRSISKVPRVRCNAVVREVGDEATFARLVTTLAAPELGWLSGCLMGTSRNEVTLFRGDQPRWRIFEVPAEQPPPASRRVSTIAATGPGQTPITQARRALERRRRCGGRSH